MASFTPPDPPFEPDEPTPPPALSVPLPPPEVGEGSPWAPADSENRDRILDWWRMWFRRVFFPWITAFTAYWDAQWNRLATYINTWIAAADEYITEHAIAGYSFRVTDTPIATEGTTDVTITEGEDVEHRPLVVGDLVLDTTDESNYGVITVVIDDTHATVQYLGSLKGRAGHGWWVTATPISAMGTTDVVLTAEDDRAPQVNDLVSDESSALRYGIITVVTDATHVTVSPLGVLRGLPGFGWWSTATEIAHGGTTAVVLSAGPDRLPQINDLVVDETASSAYGEITAITDATHVTVAYINTLQGPAGTNGTDGVVQSIVAGTNIHVDDTDPANPIVSATGGGGGGGVDSVVAGAHIHVDDTDPANPIVSGTAVLESIVAGTNVTVDDTDPANPIVSASGGGGSDDHTFDTQTLLFANEAAVIGDVYYVRNAPGMYWTATASGYLVGGCLVIQNSDGLSIFDDDFWTMLTDQAETFWFTSLDTGITYKLEMAISVNQLPWDSDWINVPSWIGSDGFELGGGTLVGMMKFSAGRICFRGILTTSEDTSFDNPLQFNLDVGLVANPADLPVPFTVIGDCWLTDGDQNWRGIMKVGTSEGADYFMFIPDVAGSDNFNGDIWAGELSASVNHAWAEGSVFEWVVELPISPTETDYDDGRSRGGDGAGGGGSYGDFPITDLELPNVIPDQTAIDMPETAHVTWNVAYGIFDSDPEAINPEGAHFEGSDLIQVDWYDDGTDVHVGYVPVLNQPIQFTGLTGVSDLVEGTTYYVNSIGGGNNDFTVSETPSGLTVSVTSGSATVATLLGITPGAEVDKCSKYDPVVLYPIADAGWYIRRTGFLSTTWLAYSF